MNVAFLLVTSALLVGQAENKPAPLPPPASVASSCCQDSCGCETFGHKLRDRLRGAFSRDCCDTCKPTTCQTHHVHTPIFKSSCDACATPACHAPKAACHTPAPCANDCGCERVGFLAKLRERFSRGDKCCDSGCSTGSCGASGCSAGVTTVMPAPKMGEKIEPAPKKMPDAPKKGTTDKKPQEVRFEIQPAPNAISVTPTVPTVEIVPAPVPSSPAPAPRVEGDRRDPF